ncbi:peptidase M61 [Sphingomonas sp.]|uniref:M61 family metallopeptidase n=1 Tax=Sphingomonas sp. TaxID=28214 RepID=UPI0025F9DB1F|nr:peptidase M61 [Sphingomonas sp.]
MFTRVLAAALLVSTAVPALAANSAPQPVAFVDTIPAAVDQPYPGVIKLKVDATDLDRAIMRVEETIPVAGAGPMVLMMPKWLPGNHSPRGPIDKLAGLVIRAGGKTLTWRRDPVDVFAFHVDVPSGVRALDVSFQFLSPNAEDQGRIVMTHEMLNIQWEAVSLYPAGYFTRQIPIQATVVYPPGFRPATALRKSGGAGDTVTYQATNYEILVDSPVYAGKYFRADDLGQGVTLNTIADDPKYLAATPQQIALHRNLVTQAVKLFGARHFDHYDFLFSLSDRMGENGLEHHRSSENGVDPAYFTDWNASLPDHNLLPHEFTHSWNGKFRRGADLWTPDFRTPMRDSLLWMYEGQTQFWGYVLEARSGLASKQDMLDAMASIAAGLDVRKARTWRSLDDTTNDPVISSRRPKGWVSWQRSEDYYNEGLLIWIEADAIIRRGTKSARGLDDFARAFFGLTDGDYGEVTYTIDDVAATLNGVMPYDWAGFLKERLTGKADHAPLGGFERSGYRLSYTDTPTNFTRAGMKANKYLDLTYSLGLNVGKEARINALIWDGPAYKAGLTVGQTIVAVNGVAYTDDAMTAAVTAAKGGSTPIRLTVKAGTRVRDVAVLWNEGLRYPRFIKTGTGETPLDKLLAPK